MSNSLEEQAAARKAKLLALRSKKRKAEGGAENGEADEAPDHGCVQAPPLIIKVTMIEHTHSVLVHRAYDRQTGQSRRHLADAGGETVETAVEGLAARIVAEDEARRKQELVRPR